MTNSQVNVRGPYACSNDTRARILEAALAEARSSGFQKLSLSGIAERADVAIGNLNYHFGSKKRLLRELMVSCMEDFVSRLSPRGEDTDFFGYEISLLRVYLDFLHENPHYIRLAEEIRHHESELYQSGLEQHIRQVSTRLEKGVAGGELIEMSSDEIRALSYVIQGAYTFMDRMVEDTHYPGDDVVLKITERLLKSGLGLNDKFEEKHIG